MGMDAYPFDLVVKNTFYSVAIEEDDDDCPSPLSPLRRQESSPALLGRRTSQNKVEFHCDDGADSAVESRRMSVEDLLSSTAASQTMEWWDPDEYRTSVMIKNLPTTCSIESVKELIDAQGFKGNYDFLYLPMKFISMSPFGYAFVNLVSPAATRDFWYHFDGLNFQGSTLAMSWSTDIQGIEEHIRRYRNSPVMHPSVSLKCKPLLFRDGEQIPFPPPTQVIKAPKCRA